MPRLAATYTGTIGWMTPIEPAVFDPYTAQFRADPYRVYDTLRRNWPIFYDERWDLTLFTLHRDVAAILKDRRFGRQAGHVLDPADLSRPEAPVEYPQWSRYVRGSFIDLEGQRHAILRRLVAKAFTKRSAESFRPRLVEVANEQLDGVLGKGEMDVIRDYATPIPLTMISELMGIPAEDRPQLVEWSHHIVRLFDYNATPDDGATAEAAVTEFADYMRTVLTYRRRHPGPDLISDLAAVEDQGHRLDDDDVIATTILTLNAGHEATVHAIGNGIVALADHPVAYTKLRDDPTTALPAAEELLRFDTPLQMFERWVLTDLEWAGVALEAGTKIGLLFGSANHDPQVFDRPQDLDLGRSPNPHVSFGGGAHLCVGAPLARIELEVAYGELAKRVSEIAITTASLDRTPSLVFRGINELHATVA